MEDDFDALIAELEGEEQKASTPVVTRAPQSTFQASSVSTGGGADELDDLLSELGGSTSSTPAQSYTNTAQRAPAPTDDLDALMMQLGAASPSPAQPSMPSQQAQTSRPPVGVSSAGRAGNSGGADELDDLLNQLEGPTVPSASSAPSRGQMSSYSSASSSYSSTPAGGDELDDLLGQLKSSAVPSPARAQAPPTVRASPAHTGHVAGQGSMGGGDELDDLMSQLEIASAPSTPYSATPTPTKTAPPSGADELDALLGQLGGAPLQTPTTSTSAYGSASSHASSHASYGSASPMPDTDDLDALISGLGGSVTPHNSPAVGRGRGSAMASPAAARGVSPYGSPATGRSMGSQSMDRTMGTPTMGSPAMGRGMGSPSMGRGMGRGIGSPAMGSPSMGRGMGSPSMGRGMGSPSMGRGMGSPSMGSSGVDLDNLLGSLNQQMTNINDGMTASKGICAFCNKPIHGDVMQALGNTYHPEHFVCHSCQEPLGTKSFYESDGQPTCDRCYKNMFCPRCAFCNEAIPDRCVTAMERKWHVKCFVCNNCLQPFPNGEFFDKGGMPYCRGCFTSNTATPCGGCGQPAMGGAVVNALNRQWHVQCFACDYCKRPFNGQPFFAKEGKAFCQQHYHQEAGGNCNGCKQPITGRCVDALGNRYHPNCFVCAYCMNPLAGGGFTERHGSPYCHECHANLF